jgi:hypothetical protein
MKFEGLDEAIENLTCIAVEILKREPEPNSERRSCEVCGTIPKKIIYDPILGDFYCSDPCRESAYIYRFPNEVGLIK